MRRPVKRDANHAEMIKALRRYRFAVTDLSHVGGGVADLYVSGSHGRSFMVEVKSAEKRGGKKRGAVQAATNERELAFRELHRGCVCVAYNIGDVLAFYRSLGRAR